LLCGDNAFSLYENGNTKPPLALVKLFNALDRRPDRLDEVEVAQCQTGDVVW